MKTNSFFTAVRVLSLVMLATSFEAVASTDIPEYVEFSYASKEPYLVIGHPERCYQGGAMLLTDEVTSRYDECVIEEVIIANGKFPNQDSAPIEIFFTYGLDEEPFMSFDSEMDMDRPQEYTAHTLPEPLPIYRNDPFYIGFVVHTAEMNDNGISIAYCLDCNYHTNLPGGFMAMSTKTGTPQKMEWRNEGYSCSQVCMKLKISGENLPVNVAELNMVSMTDYLVPSCPESAYLAVVNRGVNAITDIDVAYTVGDNSVSRNIQFHYSLGYHETAYCEMAEVTVANEGVNIPVVFNIEKVNGNDAPSTANRQQTLSVHSFSPEKGFPHAMVVEEAGGRGCGWCVRGIVGLDYMEKTYGDDGLYIPISAHSHGYGEETAPIGYDAFWKRYITHNPTCLINRNLSQYGITDPSSYWLEHLYSLVTAIPAIVEIEVTGYEFADDELMVNSEIEFGFSESEAEYSVAYVVTENHVGPYLQYNSYSGSNEDMGGWEDLPSPTPTYYDFLARGISEFDGTGGIPSDITSGVKYTHSGSVPLGKVSDRDQLHVIALLINGKTGVIENGTCEKVVASDSGISEMSSETLQLPIEYYDLSGRKIHGTPIPGIYIRKQGAESSKVRVR